MNDEALRRLLVQLLEFPDGIETERFLSTLGSPSWLFQDALANAIEQGYAEETIVRTAPIEIEGLPTRFCELPGVKPTAKANEERQRIAQQAAPAKPKRKRKAKQTKLTPIQLKTIEVVANCQENITRAAKQLKKDPSTVRQAYFAGMKKLGKEPIVYGKGANKRVSFRDARGGDDLADIDDQRRDSEEESKRKYRHRQ